jgi:preprotein translocase subunit SecA
MAIENKFITKQIESNQKKVETFHFDARKSVLEYDDVMNLQREKFYAQRNKVLEGGDLREDIIYMIEREVDRLLKTYIAPGMNPDEYIYDDLVSLVKEIHSEIPQLSYVEVKDIQGIKYENVYEKIKDFAIEAYKEHEKETIEFYNSVAEQYNLNEKKEEPYTANNVMRHLEKDILLRVVDNRWIDHLHNIDMLRDGIGLRAYGQKNPLLEYKKEAYDMFNNMMYDIQSQTVKHLFRTKFGVQIVTPEQFNPNQSDETLIMNDNREENNDSNI